MRWSAKSYGLLILVLFFCGEASAQWKTVYYQETYTDTLYIIGQDTEKTLEGFYFPPYEYLETALLSAYDLSTNLTASAHVPGVQPEHHVWQKSFEKPLKFDQHSTSIYMRAYAKDVTAYSLHFYVAEKQQWITSTYEVEKEGYQVPTIEGFSSWLEDEDDAATHAISHLAITVEVKEAREPVFALGEFVIQNSYEEEVTALQPFINRLYGMDPLLGYDVSNPLTYSTELVSTTPEAFSACKHCQGSYSMIGKAEEQEGPMVLRLLREAIRYYPYYEEKALDRAVVEAKLNEIVSVYGQQVQGKALIDALSNFVFSTFHDPHFKIEPPKKRTRRGIFPTRLFEINDRFYVAASFAPELDSWLNKEVTAVNGIVVDALLDSLAELQYGSPDRRKRLALTQMTEGFTDSIRLTFVGEPEQLLVTRTRRPKIPTSFRTKSLDFKMLDGDVAYFTIRKWELGVFLEFLNHWDQIQAAKGLILDLRNNGGGESMAAMRMFSLFIDEATTYNYSLSYVGNRQENTVIKPNNRHYFPADKRVVVLGNELTGCASEEFILAMTRLENCTFFSASHTGGSLASVTDFYFPSGLRFRTNSAADKNYFPGDQIIEDHGIAPDIKLIYNSIYDLAPYNNTLLVKSIEMLKEQRQSTGLVMEGLKE